MGLSETNLAASGQASGIRIRGETNDLVFSRNIIRDTRKGGAQKQTVGIRIEERVGKVHLHENTIEAQTVIDDRRQKK